MLVCGEGWTDGRTYGGHMNGMLWGRMDDGSDGHMVDRRTEGCGEGQTEGCGEGWTEGRTDRRTECGGQTEGAVWRRMDGGTDEQWTDG